MIKRNYSTGIFVNPQRASDGFIFAPGKQLRQLLKRVKRIANYECPVLIEGESGTGKELIARAVHYHSERGQHPLISVNCATLNNDLFCSQLFGHLKGSFTGAYSHQTGLIKAAAQGTLFLDEISSLSPSAQAQLLRFLESGEVRPVGGTSCSYPSVRIIAATNVPLKKLCQDKLFRPDLFYRLNIYSLQTVSLREETNQIHQFAHLFLEDHSKKYGWKGKRFTSEALALLTMYHWPGNVRELKAKVLQSLINSVQETKIKPEHFELDLAVQRVLKVSLERDWNSLFNEVESHYLIHQLQKFSGNQQRLIEVSQKSKNYLRNRLREYRINPKLFTRTTT